MEIKYLTRQLDIIPVDKLEMPVTIIGCGAIGSFTGLALAKMGVTKIRVYDMDTVSEENMNNQFFRISDIGTNKAVALASLIKDFTGVVVDAHPYRFEQVAGLTGIVITAVDTMSARKDIYTTIREMSPGVQYIIDPRMSAEFYAQYTCTPKTSWYKNTLYSDSEAVAQRCTAKSTIYTATLAAGLISKTVKNIITGEPHPYNIQWDIKLSENSMEMFTKGGKDEAR